MTNTEKPQPMEVDQKKPEEKTEEKVEEKPELVSNKNVESLLKILCNFIISRIFTCILII